MAERIRRYSSRVSSLLVLPAFGWFLWFLLIPLAIVAVYSLSTKGTYGGVVFHFNFGGYLRATDWIYFRIFWNSFKLAALTTVSCLILGYPMAYVMASSSRRVRTFLFALIIIPFCTNLVVRTYATRVLLGEFGPVNRLALSLGIIHQPISFLNSSFAVWFGMVTNYLPFMVLPLFVSLEKFDFSLMEAAKDLGACSWKAALKVLIPLTQEGIVTGTIFVFTPALGEFVIPDLLGGAKTMLIGNLITEQFLKTRDWPFGSALAILLILIVMVSLVIFLRSESSREKK